MKSKKRDVIVNISLCLAIASFFGIPIYFVILRPAIERQLFRAEYGEMEELLQRWGEMTPEGMNKRAWEWAFTTTYNGFGNVCFSPENVSLEEMRRLNSDLQRKLQEPPSLEALEWIWNRLGETGPRGRQYIEQKRPLFLEAMDYAKAEKRTES